MKRAIVYFAALFVGVVFADSIPLDHHIRFPLQVVWYLSLFLIGFRGILAVLRRKRVAA